jgi:hypothetical protein
MRSTNYRSVIVELKEQITREYNVKILKRMLHAKIQYVKKQSKRADFDSHRYNAGFKDPDVLRCTLPHSARGGAHPTPGYDVKDMMTKGHEGGEEGGSDTELLMEKYENSI